MEKIREHLAARPIAPIFAASNEKDSELALKLMCIIDYFIEKRGWNAAIDAVPKLREQLLQWSSFESFRFYNYSAPCSWFKKEILQCKRCEFIGPYVKTLIHMAVNHDLHIGLKKCAWCNRTDFQMHIRENTAQECYEMYLAKEQIRNHEYPKVVVEFYDLIKSIGNALDVKISRSEAFAGIGYKSKDYLLEVDSDGEMDQSIFVFSPKRKHRKEINTVQLNQWFQEAMKHYYGQEASQICNAFANTQYADPFKEEVPSDEQRTGKKARKGTSATSSQPAPSNHSTVRTQAFASHVALEVDAIRNEDVKQRTKQLLLQVIANGLNEDKQSGTP